MKDIKWPKHINFTLEHNPQASNYETVEQYLNWIEEHQGGKVDFKNEESRQKAIETNELWVFQYYPNTPVGFNSYYAPTLNELLELVELVEGEN